MARMNCQGHETSVLKDVYVQTSYTSPVKEKLTYMP
jgi:hypothetical protein